jgi:transcriptional regulator with XRE-family HTH domain
MDLAWLGDRVKALRQERGMTLQQLAATADVSVSMLSAVERGQKAATITVLGRVAAGMGMPVARLVAEPAERFIVRRPGDQEVVEEQGWRRVVLTPVVPGVNFEWIRVTLPPGCDPGEFPGYAPGSHVFVVVDSGTLRLTAGETSGVLSGGDSAYFAADVPHRYVNAGDVPCTYYVAALTMRPRAARGA